MAMSQEMGHLEILPIEEANVSGLAFDSQYHTFIMFMVIILLVVMLVLECIQFCITLSRHGLCDKIYILISDYLILLLIK